MNTDEKYALAAARLLREQMPPAPPVREPADRDQVVAAMELALAEQARRRRVLRMGGWTLAAAAALLLVFELTHAGGHPVLVERVAGPGNDLVRQGQLQPLEATTSLTVGDEVRSGQAGSATLGLGRGTTLALASASRMRVIEAGDARRFLLLQGRVDASVAKLRSNERLLVTTSDSEVEVRGTRFTVKVAEAPAGCGGASQRSTVDVQEGTVWVRSQGEERILTTGQSFTRPCEAIPPPPAVATPAPPTPIAPAPASADRKTTIPTTTSRRRNLPPAFARGPGEAPEPASQLAEQNDLLSSAMAAARAGQNDLAIRRLETLLSRFPEGPLSETARIERQRIKSAQTIRP